MKSTTVAGLRSSVSTSITTAPSLDAFLKQHKLAWPQIFEAGGMDSRLAIDYGIISLPTMFLVDAQGKVLNRNLRVAELEKQLEKLLPEKQPGVADRRRAVILDFGF